MSGEKIFIEDGQDEGPKKEERVLGAASYIPFIGIATPTLAGVSHTPFTLHHFLQGNVLFGAYLALNLLYWILPGFGFKMWGLTTLIYMILAAWGGYQAYLGNMMEYGFLKPLTSKAKELLEKNKPNQQ